MSESPGGSEKPIDHFGLWGRQLDPSIAGPPDSFEYELLTGPRSAEFVGVSRQSARSQEMDRSIMATAGLVKYLVELSGMRSKTAFHELPKTDGWLRVAIMQANLIIPYSSLPPSARIIVATEYQSGIYTEEGQFEELRSTDALVDYSSTIAVSSSSSSRQDLRTETSIPWTGDRPRFVDYDEDRRSYYVWHPGGYTQQPLPIPPERYADMLQPAQYRKFTDTVSAMFDFLGQLGPGTLQEQ